MISSMIKQNEELRKDVNKIDSSCTSSTGDITGLKFSQTQADTNIKGIKTELKQVCDEMKVLTGIVTRQAMMIEHLQTNESEREGKKLMNNIIIQGLEIDDEDQNEQNIKELVTNFFSQTMKIGHNIAIKSAQQLKGAGKSTAVQVVLTNQ